MESSPFLAEDETSGPTAEMSHYQAVDGGNANAQQHHDDPNQPLLGAAREPAERSDRSRASSKRRFTAESASKFREVDEAPRSSEMMEPAARYQDMPPAVPPPIPPVGAGIPDFTFGFSDPIPDPPSVAARAAAVKEEREENAKRPLVLAAPLPPPLAPMAYVPFGVEALKRNDEPRAAMPPPPRAPEAMEAFPEDELMCFLSPDWDPEEAPSLLKGVEATYFASLPHYFDGVQAISSTWRSRTSVLASADALAAAEGGNGNEGGGVLVPAKDKSIYLADWKALSMDRISSEASWWTPQVKQGTYFVGGAVKHFFIEAQQYLSLVFSDVGKRTVSGLYRAIGDLESWRNTKALWHITNKSIYKYAIEHYIKSALLQAQGVRTTAAAAAMVKNPQALAVHYTPTCGVCACCPEELIAGFTNLLRVFRSHVPTTEPIATDIKLLPYLCEIDVDSVLENKDFAPNVLRRLQAERLFTTRLRLKYLYNILMNTDKESAHHLLVSEAMPSRIEEFKLQLYKMKEEYLNGNETDTMRSKAEALRRQVNAQGSKLNPLLLPRLGLFEVMDPDHRILTRHFIFHEFPEALRAIESIQGASTKDLLKDLKDGTVPPAVKKVVEVNTAAKYRELARYFRDGSFMEMLSVDGAFDGERFFREHPFTESPSAYIAAIDLSTPVANLSPENYAMEKPIDCYKIFCGGPGKRLKPFMPKNVGYLFEAVLESVKAINKLQSINLSGHEMSLADTMSLAKLLLQDRVRHLDLSDCVFPSDGVVAAHITPAIAKCTKLRMVNFSNMLWGSDYLTATPLSCVVVRNLLHALHGSRASIEEIWCAGASLQRRRPENRNMGFGSLKVLPDDLHNDGSSTESILRELIQFPNLISVNFSYQELPPNVVTELIVYITKTTRVLFAFFDGTGIAVDIKVPQTCCCCSMTRDATSLIGASPSLMKELALALNRNQLRQGVTICFKVVYDMLMRFIQLEREAEQNLQRSRELVTCNAAKVMDSVAVARKEKLGVQKFDVFNEAAFSYQ